MITKERLNFLSGVIGFGVSFYFGIWMLSHDTIPQNPASWMMWAMLDYCAVALYIEAGNKKPYLQIGWAMSATFVVAILVINGISWKWDAVEIFSIIATMIATYFWIKNKSEEGLWICATALLFAGIPLACDSWKEPQIETWWLWAGTTLACVLSIVTSPKIDVKNTLVTFSAVIYNIMILLIMFR